ncbi:hypothetical protein [Streptomyces soliscabiei]|uniref:hypothetical protein n=1 Tax=Streptomyces soliscabiei TaxID=588897 RepID=UPI0029A62A64|nr:hypothetical protein [Streptomyces sp. NY05-11A]MDX2678356.1 hypothetical protein [Streptomyces sp. NY05-11A]
MPARHTEIQAEVESLVERHLVDIRAAEVNVQNGVVTVDAIEALWADSVRPSARPPVRPSARRSGTAGAGSLVGVPHGAREK